jgi:hypothetical protein
MTVEVQTPFFPASGKVFTDYDNSATIHIASSAGDGKGLTGIGGRAIGYWCGTGRCDSVRPVWLGNGWDRPQWHHSRDRVGASAKCLLSHRVLMASYQLKIFELLRGTLRPYVPAIAATTQGLYLW